MMRHQGKIAGPKLVTPIFGGIIEMIRDPYGFWERQRVWAKHVRISIQILRFLFTSSFDNLL